MEKRASLKGKNVLIAGISMGFLTLLILFSLLGIEKTYLAVLAGFYSTLMIAIFLMLNDRKC